MLKKNDFIILLLWVTFLKGLLWSFFIPLWHFPDEQAHFAHVAYLAEGGKPPIGRGFDLSEEILISEKILGTKRDGWGNNKFTYNPKFNIDYSDNLKGLREDEINNLPKETRKNFVKTEAATYNDFFYQISALVYKVFYEKNLFVRVFVLRVFWLICMMGIVSLAFLISKQLFPGNFGLQVSIPILVSFQPMFTFVSSGVTIDNLLNLLFTLGIYNAVVLLLKPNLFNLIILLIFSYSALLTKNNSFILLIIVLPSIIYFLFKKRKLLFINLATLLAVSLLSYFLIPHFRNLINIFLTSQTVPFFDFGFSENSKNYSLGQHFLWTLKHTIYEVIPWYWGVFRWLSLSLPIWLIRIFNRLLLISALGLIFKIILLLKRKLTKNDWLFFFMIYINVFYFLILCLWDWFFYRQNNYSFGIQGRYYFPVIVSHMLLLAVGFESFIQLVARMVKKLGLKRIKTEKWQKSFLIFLAFWFIGVNCFVFFLLVTSYYDSHSFQKFILQASQYKPWFAKGYWLVALLVGYVLSLSFLIFNLFNFLIKKENE